MIEANDLDLQEAQQAISGISRQQQNCVFEPYLVSSDSLFCGLQALKEGSCRHTQPSLFIGS